MLKLRDSFSATEAALIAGMPYQTVDYWARTGFILPSEREGVGPQVLIQRFDRIEGSPRITQGRGLHASSA
jgi:hypothetical protein